MTNGKNVLIVHSQMPVRFMFESSLQMSGLRAGEVFDANNGEEALARLEDPTQAKIDIIVTDVAMKGMGGLELLKRLRKSPQWKDLPVFVLVGGNEPEIGVRAIALGVTGVIEKPFYPGSLLKALEPVWLDKEK